MTESLGDQPARVSLPIPTRRVPSSLGAFGPPSSSAVVSSVTTASAGASGGASAGASGIEPAAPTGPSPRQAAEDFNSVVSAASSMFGDPTRRSIYLFAREIEGGVTAAMTAKHCKLHPNVARHHLDRLVAGGYIAVAAEVHDGRSGRPSKRYSATGKPVDLEFGAPRHDLVTTLLAKALDLLEPDVAMKMAAEVGEHYGRELAANINPTDQLRSKSAAMQAVADALTAHGFAAHAQAHGGSMSLVRSHCPFGELSATHPVICAVDRGMVRGMLHGLYGDHDSALTQSRAQGDDVCVSTL